MKDPEVEKLYLFTFSIVGGGENPDTAWLNAVEVFSQLDPGDKPGEYRELTEEDQ